MATEKETNSADDLMEFLRARLNEDEQGAREVPDVEDFVDDLLMWSEVSLDHASEAHVRRHDPARVLREVEAKRRIIERYEEYASFEQETLQSGQDPHLFSSLREAYLDACRSHAAVFADHPDYREEWRP